MLPTTRDELRAMLVAMLNEDGEIGEDFVAFTLRRGPDLVVAAWEIDTTADRESGEIWRIVLPGWQNQSLAFDLWWGGMELGSVTGFPDSLIVELERALYSVLAES